MAEYHALAYHYGWGFDALRALSRTYRHGFCRKVVEQMEAEGGKGRGPFNSANDDAPPKHGGRPYREGG